MAARLKLADGNDAHTGALSQFQLAQIDEAASCSALCWGDHMALIC